MVEINANRWRILREQRGRVGITTEVVGPALDGCLIGIDADGRLHLLVAVAEEPREFPSDMQAFSVRVVEGDRTYIDVSAGSHHEELFTLVANRIVYAIEVQRRLPIHAVTETITEFRNAFKNGGPEISNSEQIGLFGELWVLWRILIPAIGSRACELWSGPQRERHDFVGQSTHIEVKTTTTSEDRHEISRLDQLRAPPGKRLLFASIQLEKSIGGEETIATKIDDIYRVLGRDGRAIDIFEKNLKNLKWHDGLRQSGTLLRFNLRSVFIFDVAGSFPRLPDDYVPPRGIVSIKYSIDISAQATLGEDEVTAIVSDM